MEVQDHVMVMGLGTCLHGGVEGTGPGGQQVWSSHLLLGQLQIGPLEAVIPHMEDSSPQPPCCWGGLTHIVLCICVRSPGVQVRDSSKATASVAIWQPSVSAGACVGDPTGYQ